MSEESSAYPEIQRLQPLSEPLKPTPVYSRKTSSAKWTQTTPQPPATAAVSTAADPAETLGPNLIQNPSVETSSAGLPTQWRKGGYGTNTRTFTYPVAGHNSPSGLRVAITAYTSGDAKWYFDPVTVNPGKTYQFSDFYSSDVNNLLTAQFKLADGTFSYKDIAVLSPNASYTNVTARFTVPANASSATIFHLIKSVGTLTTDEFSLNEVIPTGTDNNLILNPGFESEGLNGPLNWTKGGSGTNTRSFSYPVLGVQNSKAAKVAISSYTSGDAKWVFDPVAVDRGIYTYGTDYKSDIPSIFTARFQNLDNSFKYQDIATVAPSGAFGNVSTDFWIPLGVRTVTVFHLIKQIGGLTIDNTSLRLKAHPTGIFTTGAISLTFDDGWLSQFTNAVPKMNAAGLKATFYIISRQFAEDGYPGHMSKAQVAELAGQGHEIGAHTRTHPALSQLTPSEQQDEVQGSRQDLLAMNIGPVLTFAYPFGDYNSTTLQIVKDAGYTSARATLSGYVVPTTDKFQLRRFGAEVTTTFDQIKQAIDTAIANKEWLIIVFHQIVDSSERYTTPPALFNQVVDYLVQTSVPVIPVSQGLSSMQ